MPKRIRWLLSIQRMPWRSDVFVRAAARAVGVDTALDLFGLLYREGEVPASAQGNVNKWWNGKAAPRYEPVMALMERAGWLTPEALAALAKEEAEAAERAARRAASRAGRKASPPRRRENGGDPEQQ